MPNRGTTGANLSLAAGSPGKDKALLYWRVGLAFVLWTALGAEAARAQELPPPPVVAPPLQAAPSAPAPPPPPTLLHSGQAVTLRILQVVPADGLSPGERLLNGRNPILPGDRFLAEVIEPPSHKPALVGGIIAKVVRPGWFGRPGSVTLQLAQFVQTADGNRRQTPWQVNTEDRQLATRMRRALLSALLSLEWASVGAAAGAQNFALFDSLSIGAAAAGGLLFGIGYSSFQRGTEANLEPGDTFRIVVGGMKYQAVSREWQTILYPASDPAKRKVAKKQERR